MKIILEVLVKNLWPFSQSKAHCKHIVRDNVGRVPGHWRIIKLFLYWIIIYIYELFNAVRVRHFIKLSHDILSNFYGKEILNIEKNKRMWDLNPRLQLYWPLCYQLSYQCLVEKLDPIIGKIVDFQEISENFISSCSLIKRNHKSPANYRYCNCTSIHSTWLILYGNFTL